MTRRSLTAASALALILTACAQTSAAPAAPVTETVTAPAAVERVTQGNLVLESIPAIPSEVSDRLSAYENVRSHGFLDWTGDGGILITTRFADTNQVHEVNSPGGARKQLTFFDEPVGNATVSPEGGAFLFARDKGGDEYYQGYRFDLETGVITRFTEPGTRNGGALWSDDGSQAAWARTNPGDPNNDIIVGNPADAASVRVALEGEGATGPVDWSNDGSKLLLQRYISISESRLFVLDVASGETTQVNPDDTVAYSGGALLPDGSVLTATDKDSEFTNLVRIAPDGGVTNYTADINWGVSDWDLSPDGKTVAFTLNEGGLGTIRLLDIESGQVRPGPTLPVGIASGIVYSPSGNHVGFTFNSAISPADAWSFDVATLNLTRWTEAETGGLNTENFVEPTLFDYPNAEGMDIPAFIYKPASEGPHPVIISIHGGPEGQSRPGFSSSYQYWANELGLAVVVPNVRGSAGYGKTYVSLDNGLNRKKSVEDIGALLDWVEAQPDLDASKVIVYGGSYGGYMVLASMIDYADRLAAGVDIVGISDFKTFLENTEGYRADLRRAEYGDERDPVVAAFFDEISPLKNASKISKPLFVIQGYNDPRVPYTEAEQILAAVKSNGVPAWFMMAMDEGHGFRKKSNREAQREAETMFLKEVLELE
ncbi:prolyl oligopeptidase family serine peptidase [Hyphomonas sp. WL0036]|uniref:prolyl oligopeptidase family serine peptidase n=1 Tax=Hyphomonas sediminis TaxID=2866160 RepID=UPI001C7F18FB|nr:prolyl oligopeptidase family serine peptidase [Hyphomonas sediminis]MBY9066613.1 prolyl oligopeptidase family serine peptidase [Hyphomonas sediminis]